MANAVLWSSGCGGFGVVRGELGDGRGSGLLLGGREEEGGGVGGGGHVASEGLVGWGRPSREAGEEGRACPGLLHGGKGLT